MTPCPGLTVCVGGGGGEGRGGDGHCALGDDPSVSAPRAWGPPVPPTPALTD